jgi:hypothetical protein
MFKHLFTSFVAVGLLLVAVDASAVFCLPQVHYRCVGDHAVDSAATDATIQLAITNATCPNTVITITHEIPSALSSLALEINGKTNLTLVGAPSGGTCAYITSCDPEVGCGGGGTPPAPVATLHGNGAGSVIYIHGNSSVTLESLELTGGGGTDFGGGIHFTGSGALTIINSTITGNTANTQGGGIQFNGSGGNATLTLDAGTIIENNTSGGDGGGIHINGSARMFALAPYTTIYLNHAGGHGGGIEVAGPAQADIGSPGYNGLAVIYGNDSAYGGGISADSTSQNTAFLRLFTTDPANPVAVSSNLASHTGGGIYLKPDAEYTPVFCAYDFRIDNNAAQEGSAIYGDEDSAVGNYYGAEIYLNTGPGQCATPEPIDNLGAVRCAVGSVCNTVNGNIAEDSSNHPTAGSAILAQTAASMIVNRLIMRSNHGAHAIRTFGPYGNNASIVNCLIADNTLTAEMIRIDDDGLSPAALTTFDGCTIVNNSNQGAPVIYSAHDLTLTNSIIDEESIFTLNYTGNPGGLNVSYVLSNDTSTLQGGTGVIQGAPTYVDAAGHDYHLQATSIGIDYAPATGGSDLDRAPRDVDLAAVPNNYGQHDIGAYERQYVCTPDTIYCNGFDTYQ